MFDSQEEVLKELNGQPKILELGTGSGKTLISLQEYLDNWSEYKLLIVCPNGKFREGGWDREIQVMEDYYGVTFDYDIIPYSQLWNKKKERGKKSYIKNEALSKYENYFIIFDEVHFVKNPTSERGKAATTLIEKSKSFIGLSATPMANGWEDTMNYFIWYGIAPNKTQFIRQYSSGLDKYYKPYGWKHDDLKPLWDAVHVYRDKHSMTDLPKLRFKDVFFKKSKAYTDLIKTRMIGDEMYDTVPKLIAKLRYLTNAKHKQEYTKELLESTEENVVIFYTFNDEYFDLLKIIPKNKDVFVVRGGEFSLPKKEKWDKIKNSVTLVQYKAGGTGIEMQYASEVIMYSPDNSFQDYEQALGRVYRTGQTENVTVYRYRTKGTIEIDVWRNLRNKKTFNPRKWLSENEIEVEGDE